MMVWSIKYSVNGLVLYVTNNILMLHEQDADAHCPMLVTFEPSDLSNKEKKACNTDEQKKQRAATSRGNSEGKQN